MSFWKRLFGICRTQPPADAACWRLEAGDVDLDLARAPELAAPGGAVRLEGGGLPERVLVVHGSDGGYHAFANRCTHGKRRLDPEPGQPRVRCCSVGRSLFDYEGRKLEGAAEGPLTVYRVVHEDGRLRIELD